MKRVLSLVLSLCTMLLCLTSCDVFNELLNEHTEHTFEYIAYEECHFKQFTCGCPSPEIAEMHYDNDADGICDACGYMYQIKCPSKWVSGPDGHSLIMLCDCCDAPAVIKPHEDENVDFICDVCGYEITLIDPPVNYFLRNQAGCEWLCEISVDDISHIKIINKAVGVAPGSFKFVSTSYDEEVIAKIFESYYSLNTIPDHNYVFPDGGGAVTVQFIMDDGSVKQIYINNGFYCDSYGDYFELSSIPKFDETDNYVSSYGFITYIGTSTIWHNDPASLDAELVSQIPTDMIEFIELMDDIAFGTQESEYFIETEFANLIFVSDSCFYIAGDSHIYYELVGKTILQLIEEYTI